MADCYFGVGFAGVDGAGAALTGAGAGAGADLTGAGGGVGRAWTGAGAALTGAGAGRAWTGAGAVLTGAGVGFVWTGAGLGGLDKGLTSFGWSTGRFGKYEPGVWAGLAGVGAGLAGAGLAGAGRVLDREGGGEEDFAGWSCAYFNRRAASSFLSLS